MLPGFSLHQELQRFVDAGFTPMEALQTATINPAKFLDRLADFGTVEKGKIADLVLLDANPLERHPQHAQDRRGRRQRPLLPPREAGRDPGGRRGVRRLALTPPQTNGCGPLVG